MTVSESVTESLADAAFSIRLWQSLFLGTKHCWKVLCEWFALYFESHICNIRWANNDCINVPSHRTKCWKWPYQSLKGIFQCLCLVLTSLRGKYSLSYIFWRCINVFPLWNDKLRVANCDLRVVSCYFKKTNLRVATYFSRVAVLRK